MRISGLNLYNFKGFNGHHSIEGLDSGLSEDQNVILFGGLNGAGKTTFLESLFLCFYGRDANQLYPSRGARLENYESYIISLLNNDIKFSGNLTAKMSVEISLKDVPLTGNFPRNVSFKRSWDIILGANSRINDETFVILENGEPIQDLEEGEYEDRVKNILPYNVSQFFFFDGEKIQDFAADADKEFANSLKDVLGITHYAILADDLKKVKSQMLTEFNKNKDSAIKLKENEVEKFRLEKSLEEIEDSIVELSNKIVELEIEKSKIDQETFRFTRIKADSRDDFDKQKEDKEREKEFLEKEYIESAKEDLPFILCSAYFEPIESQLKEEQKFINQQVAQKEIEPKIDQIVEAVFDNQPPCPEQDIKFKTKTYYREKIEKAIRDFLFDGNSNEFETTELIHNLSPQDTDKVISFLHSLNDSVVKKLNDKADRLKQIDITLDKIRSTGVRSGDNSEEVKKLFDKKDHISKEIGGIAYKIENLKGDKELGIKRIEILKREITNWEEKAKVNKEHKVQIDYCESLILTIQDFQKEFQAQRTVDLQNAISEMWNKLTHKERLVNAVKVLPDSNFEVELFDIKNNVIDKTKLSAGEKEIYAISLLWALVQVSGKKFPIVIDTPFGKLDSHHRTNLLKNYFPLASHQVILLSQDEEIVGKYYDLIKPSVAKEFTIESKGDLSEVREGYPFKNLESIINER